jgi:CDP-glycerol glycerophosphotransferase (TagB/SpsB family)
VAWQKLADVYVALYGTTPIQIRSLPTLNDIFEDEEGQLMPNKADVKAWKAQLVAQAE